MKFLENKRQENTTIMDMPFYEYKAKLMREMYEDMTNQYKFYQDINQEIPPALRMFSLFRLQYINSKECLMDFIKETTQK